MTTLLAFTIFFLLILSAIFSSSETSLTSLSRARIHGLAKKGGRRARIVYTLLGNMERLIGTILVGNNFVNILSTSLMTSLLIRLFGESGVGLATLVMVLLILIFAEVMPKVYAIQYPERVALNVAYFIYWCTKLLSPISRVLRVIVRVCWRILGVDVGSDKPLRTAKEEILTLLDMYSETQIQKEKNMLKGILDLSTVPLESVMVHRNDLHMLDGDAPIRVALKEMMHASYTRYPIYDGSDENIIGIVHIKSLIKAVDQGCGEAAVKSLLKREPWFVPESTSLLKQLQAFRQHKAHMAIVVDEYGAFQGIVTLEDILEEIVGDISDEYDAASALYKKEEEGIYVISGMMPLRDLNRELHTTFPDQHAVTLGGLLLHEIRDFPQPGEQYQFYGHTFEILGCRNHKISRVRMKSISHTASVDVV